MDHGHPLVRSSVPQAAMQPRPLAVKGKFSLSEFLAEARRRRVIRVLVLYAIAGWVIIQVASTVLPGLNVPAWSVTLVIVLVALGLPLAAILAWAFDVEDGRISRSDVPDIRSEVEHGPLGAGAAVPLPTDGEPVAKSRDRASPAHALDEDRRSIAVLPFVNMSGDPENEYFSDGISEEILNLLTKLPKLRVPSRTSSFAFKGTTEDIRQVGKKLDVATVLEGSVRKAGNKLRITAQLVNVGDGYQLWSQRYDRDMEDVFAIQDEIAQNIVKALRVILSEDEKRAIEQVPTANVEAYDCYLRGRQFFHQFRKQSIEFARQMFNKAIEIDPTYALAYAGVADCCSVLYTNFDATEANLSNADTASRRALELAPQLAEAHVARGLAVSLLGQYAEAETEFETAMGLNPQLFDAAYMYGRGLVAQGKYDKAVRILERAAELRPEDYVVPEFLGAAYARLGRTVDSQRAYRRAVDAATKRLELNPDDPRALYMGGTGLARLGEVKRAKDWGAQALAISPGDATVLYNVACIYSTSGETDEAITLLERAIAAGFGHWKWIENDSDFDSLRNHPRYEAMMAKATERPVH